MGDDPLQRGDAGSAGRRHDRHMTDNEISARLDLLEAAVGAVLRLLPADAVQQVQAALGEHVNGVQLDDDLDAVLAGAVARLLGLG